MNASPSSSDSHWTKVISTHGQVRGVAVQATDLVRELCALHGLKGMGARGLGEATVAALLVASYCKAGERVNVNIRGSGHFAQALVDAHPEGHVRGFVVERSLSAEERGRLTGEGPWGEGILAILRTKGEDANRPYIGSVPLITGHLAKDLTFYWHQSEQVPSAVGIVVDMDGEAVRAAGGFLVQAMPGADAVELRAIETHIQSIHSLAGEFLSHADPMKVLSQIFQSTSFHVLEEKPLRFECNCSRDRVERALRLVGADEIRSMIEKDGQAEIKCDFCSKAYVFDREKLAELLKPNPNAN